MARFKQEMTPDETKMQARKIRLMKIAMLGGLYALVILTLIYIKL